MDKYSILKQYYGHSAFRAGQEALIDAILSGRDALCVMPTGGGKSLCYQVPALLLPGLTLVISPLISLMQDQVKGLNAAGIHAAFINSSLTETQIARALDLAAEGSYKLVYVAPERLESPVFRSFAAGADISMVTVDEAHCISQWGQDFRPSYLKILDFIDSLPRRPIVSAFTATATREVKDDIVCTLRLHDPKVLVTGFDRPNLYFQVERTRRKDDFVIQYLRDHPGESGIIYCATRKNVDKLQELLTEYGFAATKYHAGLPAEARRKNQNDFIYDTAPVIVATNAFGMGIDKSNVRFVLHYNMPPFATGETGRVGSPKRREIGHGRLAKRALKAVLPTAEEFQYTIRVVSEITESNGSSSMASVCGGCLSMLDAGVPLKDYVAGVAMGLIKEGNKFAVLTDILGDEDHLGDMDFKVAGTAEGVTALQMDIKIEGITAEIMQAALAQAHEGRQHILGKMHEMAGGGAKELSDFAPRMISFKIDQDKIREVIGKGGATIRALTEETGTTINIEDDGTVTIASPDTARVEEARRRIEIITAKIEVGQIYEGTVQRLLDFGAIVQLLPGKDGLLHISQIANERVNQVSDYLKEGQQVRVKVIEADEKGRVRLSMKALLKDEAAQA